MVDIQEANWRDFAYPILMRQKNLRMMDLEVINKFSGLKKMK